MWGPYFSLEIGVIFEKSGEIVWQFLGWFRVGKVFVCQSWKSWSQFLGVFGLSCIQGTGRGLGTGGEPRRFIVDFWDEVRAGVGWVIEVDVCVYECLKSVMELGLEKCE